jgi:hypothetical protein
MIRLARVMVRRSVGLPVLPVLLAVVAVHILGRARPWTSEWMWAVYQYHFLTVLLAPVAVGIAAWEGTRLARASDTLGAAGRVLPALAASWAALYGWVLAAYLVGLLAVIGVVKASGTPGWPGLAELATLAPPLSLLAGDMAVGIALGWRLRSVLTAPAAAVAVFGLTILFYSNGPTNLVEVGGATDSLVGLVPRASRQAAQVAWYAALGGFALLLAEQCPGWPRMRARRLRVSSGVVAVAALLLLLTIGGPEFDRRPVDLRCHGPEPLICLAPGYDRRSGAIREAVVPYVRALKDAGLPLPGRFVQLGERPPDEPRTAILPVQLVLGDRSLASSAVLSAFVPSGCDVAGDRRTGDSFIGLSYWIEARAAGRPFDDNPTLPMVLRTGSAEQQRTWLRSAIDTLAACGAR